MAENLTRQKMNVIFGAFLFHNVDEFIVEQLISDPRCLVKRYKKGEVVYSAKSFQRSLGLLLSGRIRVEKERFDGSVLTISTLEPGECFGAAAMFHDEETYVNQLTAIAHTEVFYIPQALLSWMMQRDPRITKNYISYLSQRILFLNEKISVLSAGTAEERLKLLLLQRGSLKCSMTSLSQELNLGRASLYRAIASLESKGIIRQEKNSIVILDDKGLRGT